ncbi:zinc finger protein 394 isoform X1 [Thunnus thynnus]|uniref:zinc finger protein 394 isoform X1 n=1 Tax=Thunnus thynnus TaxID=8237 RepID=UPI003527E663
MMVNYCVCAGCTNSNLSGHRVHSFPDNKKNEASFRAWVHFVQVKRPDFTTACVTQNAVVCGAHFRQEDYAPGDMMAFRMGFRSPDRVRLITGAVPSVHAAAASGTAASGGGLIRDSARRKCKSRPSSEHLAVRGGTAGKGTSSSVMTGNGHWDSAGAMDQITVVRIDDTHIAEEQSQAGGKLKDEGSGYYEVEYSLPAAEEVVGEEEEEDGVYVIEYSNPEEEGESYQFTMSVDRSLPAKKPIIRHPAASEPARAASPVTPKPSRPTRQRPDVRQKRKMITEEEEVKKEEGASFNSNKSVLELGEDYSEVMGMNTGSDKRQLKCSLCPPPGRCFKRASGLAVHLKLMHNMEGKKTFFCSSCKQTVRTQLELDVHTRRHANHDAVFTCFLCSDSKEEEEEGGEKAGFKGSRWGLRRHLEAQHPGIIPRCDICNKGFKSLVSYLSDQFRHVGVSPYYCAKCKIYEMTERGLSVHLKNHDKKQKMLEAAENHLLTHGVSTSADNSATDDSDF